VDLRVVIRRWMASRELQAGFYIGVRQRDEPVRPVIEAMVAKLSWMFPRMSQSEPAD
jgi:hypothetical protein